MGIIVTVHRGRMVKSPPSWQGVHVRSVSEFRMLETPDGTPSPPGTPDESIVDINTNDLTGTP